MEEIATKDLRFVAQGVVIDPLGRTHTPAVSAANVSIRPPRATMDLLPLIPIEDGDSSSGLRMGGTIGQGGMGLVRKATQLALDREVAAKTVRPDRRNPETIKQLLQEAWITGRLEHPNIVPIYSLGQTEEGAPVLVMKRIEGTRWTMMMHNPAARPDDASPGIEWNLKVLSQVCNAIEFAHEKGIIHRDLKPDNIMIGSFGEVYVLDWGLAISLDDDGSGRLPHVSQVNAIVGTPSYMAPEMFGLRGHAIGPWTDVYLLGGMLHKVLTGEPPHEGSLEACFESASREAPRNYGPHTPKELTDICHRAMRPNPRERFSSVRELRESLARALEHTTSIELTIAAKVRLERIELSLADNTTLAQDDDQLLSETIFGFEHALRIWHGNKEAEDGLQQALEHAFFQAVAHLRLSIAEHWLRRMPHPRSDHNRALAEGRAAAERRARDAAEAERHRRGHDLNVGREERVRLAIFAAMTLSTMPWVDALLEGLLRPAVGAAVLFVAPTLAWAIALSATVLGRVANTEIARKIACACLMAAALSTTLRYLVFTGTIVTERLLLLDLVPFLVILAMFALFIDPRLRVSLGLAAVAFGSALHAPSAELPFFFALAHLLGVGSIAWIWSKPTDEVACNPVAHHGGKGSRAEADSSS